MGTRGFIVYRHRGWYIIIYNQSDSYPEGLGRACLSYIPEEGDEFLKWLNAIRAKLDKRLVDKGILTGAELPQHPRNDGPEASQSSFGMKGEDYEDDAYEFEKEPPLNDLFIEWIYEMDLDNLSFSVDNKPLFRLDHRPPLDEFSSYVGFNHYGHRSCSADTPDEYRYTHPLLLPPASTEDLDFYDGHKGSNGLKSPHQLLGITEYITSLERLRTRLLEVIVGSYLVSLDGGHALVWLSTRIDRKGLILDERSASVCLLDIALNPPIFDSSIVRNKIHEDDLDLIWLRRDTCAWLSVQLNDVQAMKAAVAQLVSAVLSSGKQGLVFGIVFSLCHIVIVAVNTSTGTFEHTTPLQFLPSAYATSPSTPGIEALARLSCRPDPSFAWGMLDVKPQPAGKSGRVHLLPVVLRDVPIIDQSNILVQRFPSEIWHYVAALVISPADLVSLGKVSRQCRDAVADVIRWPRISNVMLRKPVDGTVAEGVTFYEGIEEGYPASRKLCVASFEVDTDANVEGSTPEGITVWGAGVPHSNYWSEKKVTFSLQGILHSTDVPFSKLCYVLKE